MTSRDQHPSDMEKTSKPGQKMNPDDEQTPDMAEVECSDDLNPVGDVNPDSEAQTISKSKNKIFKDTDEIEQLGPYKIERILGQGGMGQVLLGEDTGLMRKSAIKVIANHLAQSSEAQKRLEVEARAAARLNHPNIVQVYAFGEDQGLTYIAFEYVDGQDLDSIVKKTGKMELEKALDVALQASKGLRFGYSQNVIHRDIKPANLMMMSDGTVKIADFGLAKELDKDYIKTRTDTIVGSPAYMSPEQGMGRTLDFRSDIYSLGATLYALLTGAVPYIGESALSVLLMHANEPLPFHPELKKHIDGEVMGLIHKMMAKKPEDRHKSYDELIEEINVLLEAARTGNKPKTSLYKNTIPAATQSVLDREIKTTAAASKTSKMNLWLPIMGVAGFILTVAIFIMIFSGGNSGSSSTYNPNSTLSASTTERPPLENSTNSNSTLPIPNANQIAAENNSGNTEVDFQTTLPSNSELGNTSNAVSELDSIDSEYVSMVTMTQSERQTAAQVAGSVLNIERQLFFTVNQNTPLTVKPPGMETLEISKLPTGRLGRLVNGQLEAMPVPPMLDPDIKTEIAKWVSENVEGVSPAERNLLDFYRFMYGDERVTRDELLERSPNPTDREKLEIMTRYLNVWQDFTPTPPAGLPGGGPGNRPGPGTLRNNLRQRNQ